MLQNSDPLKKRLKFQFWMPQRRNWQFWASGIGRQFSTTSKDSHEEEMFFFGLVRTFSKNWCKMKPLHLLWGSRTESRNELNQTSNFILHTPHLSPNLTKLFCYNVSFSLLSTQVGRTLYALDLELLESIDPLHTVLFSSSSSSFLSFFLFLVLFIFVLVLFNIWLMAVLLEGRVFCLKIVCVKAFSMHGPRNGNRWAKSDGEVKKKKMNE